MDEVEDVTAEESPSEEEVTEQEGESPSPETEETEAAESEESTSTEPEAEAQTDEPEEFKNALNKYKGDKAAFARHYWQTQQDNARLAKELKALQDQTKASPAKAEPEPEPEDLSPELKELESYMGSLEEEKKALPEVQNALLKAAVDARKEVIRTETRLEIADAMDKDAWEQKLRIAEAREREANREYQQSRNREGQIATELKRVARERDGIKRQLESDRERQEQAARDLKVFMDEFPAKVDAWIWQALDELNVTKDKDYRQMVWEDVNPHLIVQYGRMQGVPNDQVDHYSLIKSQVQKQLQRYDKHRTSKFVQVSKDKLAVTQGKPAQPKAKTPPAPQRRTAAYETAQVDPKVEAARRKAAALGWTE